MSFDLIGKAVKKLRLPTVEYDYTPVRIIPAQLGDVNSRFFIIEIYDDRGTICLSHYDKVTLNATLPDETLQICEGEINKLDNNLVIKIGGSMLTMAGKVTCDIMLTGKDAGNNIVTLTSQTFYLFVAQSQINDSAVESNDDYGLLVKLLMEVTAIEDDIKIAESARVQAELGRVEAEDNRIISEVSRIESETVREGAERERIEAETNRETKENERQENEARREAAETLRVAAEEERAANEATRLTSEQTRVEAEQAREVRESERRIKENSRNQAESRRANAEVERQAQFESSISDCGDAAENANNAAQTVQELLSALPCPTSKVDGDVEIPLVALRFVALEE